MLDNTKFTNDVSSMVVEGAKVDREGDSLKISTMPDYSMPSLGSSTMRVYSNNLISLSVNHHSVAIDVLECRWELEIEVPLLLV